MKPKKTCINNKNRCIAGFGVTAFSSGIILLLLKQWLLGLLTGSLLVLKPNTLIEGVWSKIGGITTDFYFLNWTNPEDFLNHSTKPKFEEIGPYRFIQNMEKVNVTWNDNNTVTYSQLHYLRVDENNAKGNFSDAITCVNTVTASFSHIIRHWNYFAKKAASVMLSTVAPGIHHTRTAKETLLDGYDDFIMELSNYLPFVASEIPRPDEFSIVGVINGSPNLEGIVNIKNGEDGSYDILSWNYQNTSPYFHGSCGKVHGSAGELYYSNPSKEYLEVFYSMVCRSLRLDFEEVVTIDGILGNKYSVGQGVLDNGTLIPENECFCAGDCIPSGMINISSCLFGLPAFLSLPHFYRADSVYLNAVEGLRPKKSKHEAYIVIEPNTGVTLELLGRIQLNLFIHPIEDISVFEDVPEIFFPLTWIEQRYSVPDHVVPVLKFYLNAPYILTGIASSLITLGLLLTFIPLLVSWCRRRKTKDFPSKPENVPLRSQRETPKMH